MIRDTRTESYEQPFVPLDQKEHELHVHYSSNALARGHKSECGTVTAARNWPTLFGRPACTCALMLIALVFALPALAANTVTTQKAGAMLQSYLNNRNAKMLNGGTPSALVGSTVCTITMWPTWGKPPLRGVEFYCLAQVVNRNGVSLGLGMRSGWRVQALNTGGWRFLPVTPMCAPPHFCDPATMNVGGGLTNG